MNVLVQLLFNPAIISLCVGIVGGLFSTLIFPAALVDILSLYLIFAIGLKGGMCLGTANQCTPPLLNLTLLGVGIGLIQPFIHYFILRRVTALDAINAAAVATAYGSISIVTFITTTTFLNAQGIDYDTFMPALAGIMEIPALVTGLWLIKQHKRQQSKSVFSTFFDIARAKIGRAHV